MVMSAVTGAVAGVCLASLLATAGDRLLPQIMDGDAFTTAMAPVGATLCLLSLAALAGLASRRPIRYSTCG
jgi:hypothetical protein